MEIEANELMVGNLVLLDTGFTPPQPHRVRSIDIYTIESKSLPEQVTVEALPLTEEKAKALGFIKDGNGNWWRDFGTHYLELIFTDTGVYPVLAQIPELGSATEQRITLQNIHSVHELQNLVFWTMNEELDYEN